MEDTLRGEGLKQNTSQKGGLNPCFNGRYSQRKHPKRSGGKI